MKTKKFFSMMLMAMMVIGLSFVAASCSDDDDKKKEESAEDLQAEMQAMDPYGKNTPEAMDLLTLVSQICNVDSLPNDWKTATFNPVLGDVLDESQPFVRTLVVDDISQAAALYQSLSGTTIEASTSAAMRNIEGVGSLIYNAPNYGGVFATIDVDVKQIPRLTQLRLVSESSVGENGILGIGNYTFDGDPYYRIGDVVKDKDGRYWICVRSAWSGKKGDTHWVTMQILSKKLKNGSGFDGNLQTYKANKSRGQHVLPTRLGNNAEKMKYFAQLMAVLTKDDTEQLTQYFTGDGPLKNSLGDLGFDAHSTAYCKALGRMWDMDKVWEKILPGVVDENGKMEKGEVTKDYFDIDKNGHLIFFYNGYSSPGWSQNVTLYVADHTGDAYSKQTLDEWKWDMTVTYEDNELRTFDIRDFVLTGKKGEHTNLNLQYQGTFGNYEKGVVLVYATGGDLANTFSEPDPTKKIDNVEDVFLGNERIGDASANTIEPKPCSYMGSDCNFYEYYEDCGKAGVKPVAFVIYYDKNASKGAVERDKDYKGLAIALTDLPEQCEWAKENSYGFCGGYEKTINSVIEDCDYKDYKDGIAKTQTMQSKACNKNHDHPAASEVKHYRSSLKMNQATMEKKGFSDFFIPSVKQWEIFFDNWDMELKDNYVKVFGGGSFFGIIEGFHLDLKKSIYWTSTSSDEKNAYVFQFGNNPITCDTSVKNEAHLVRPFIAF